LSKQLDALGVVKKQASTCRVKYYAAVSSSLTPEQKKKFMEIQGQQAQ
jgi:Spy/CpxP family protein refolding chaperone